MSQENLQTMIMQNFWGVKEVYYGICTSSEWTNSGRRCLFEKQHKLRIHIGRRKK